MTTLVVVAVDDFSLRVESDDPKTPAYLLAVAEMTQGPARELAQRAMLDLAIWGVATLPFAEYDIHSE